jgi:trimeric autotransporter adhesin
MKNLLYFICFAPFLAVAQRPELLANVQQKGDAYFRSSANVNGQTFFNANNNINGDELWKTDGTTAGTVMVKDIYVGSNYSSPQEIVSCNNKAFFSATDATNGKGLWSSDGRVSNGTTTGTTLLKDTQANTFV